MEVLARARSKSFSTRQHSTLKRPNKRRGFIPLIFGVWEAIIIIPHASILGMEAPVMTPRFEQDYAAISRAIQSHYAKHGKAPTIRKIAQDTGIPATTVTRRLLDMEDTGRIHKDYSTWNGNRLA